MNDTEELEILNKLHRDLYKKLGYEDETYKLYVIYYSWVVSSHKRQNI